LTWQEEVWQTGYILGAAAGQLLQTLLDFVFRNPSPPNNDTDATLDVRYVLQRIRIE
jgi:hypothetical protein